MKKYALIDTSILFDLVARSGVGRNLRQVLLWLEEGHIELLVPEQLHYEWKNRETTLNMRIKKNFDQQIEAIAAWRITAGIKMKSPILTPKMQEVVEQIAKIQNLLNQGIQIENYADVSIIVQQLRMDRRPPFHKKLDSESDAYILLNSLHYAREKELSSIVFISKNWTEFSPPSEPQIFHPELASIYPEVKVEYYTSIGEAVSAMITKGLPALELTVEYETDKVVYPIDRSTHIIDQVYNYLSLVFKEWRHLPHEFFLNQYPFLKGGKAKYYKLPFTSYIENTELYGILSSLSLREDKLHSPLFAELSVAVENAEEKINAIVELMTRSLVENISDQKFERNPKHFFVFDPTKTEWPLAKWLSFDLTACIDVKTLPDRTPREILDKAYLLYKLGSYWEAAQACLMVVEGNPELAKLESDHSSYFIAHYSLKKLYPYLKREVARDSSHHDLLKHIENIDLEEVLKKSTTPGNASILRWLHNKEFLHTHGARISKLNLAIRELYHKRNSGSNHYYYDIEFTFRELVAFFQYNAITYDEYEEIEQPALQYIESLFASYASAEGLSGRVKSFSDQQLLAIVRWCDFETLQQYIDRYKIQSIKYAACDDENTFPAAFQRMLVQYPSLCSDISKLAESAMHNTWQLYSQWMYRCVLLTAYVDLSLDNLMTIAESLLIFLNIDTHTQPYFMKKSVRKLVKKKGAQLETHILQRYFIFFSSHKTYQDDVVVDDLADILNERHPEGIGFSATEFEEFKNNELNLQSLREKEANMSIVADFFRTTSIQEQKREISDSILMQLQQKFDWRMFYSFAIRDIIDAKSHFREQYHLEMQEYIASEYEKYKVAKRVSIRNRTIDSYLNYCFKEEYVLPHQFQNMLYELDVFYSWLLDMEGFNYEKFETAWLSRHFTIFYKKKFKESTSLYRYLLDHIRKNANSEVQGVFIHIHHI